MPDVKNPNVKSIDAALEQVTYPSSVDDMLSSDTPFEGTANALPPSGTNPVFGADGALSSYKITRITSITGATPDAKVSQSVPSVKNVIDNTQD